MLRKSALIGLFIMAVGTLVLRSAIRSEKLQRQLVAAHRSSGASSLDDYLKEYNQWLLQPADKRGELPWGLDRQGNPKTEQQLYNEQQHRLMADLDMLLVTEPNMPNLAEILYGKNWRQQLEEYRKQKEDRELVMTASMAVTSFGGITVGGCLLIWLMQWLSRAIGRLNKKLIGSLRDRYSAMFKPTAVERVAPSPRQHAPAWAPRTEDKHARLLNVLGWHNIVQVHKDGLNPSRNKSTDAGGSDESARSQKAQALARRSKWYDPAVAVDQIENKAGSGQPALPQCDKGAESDRTGSAGPKRKSRRPQTRTVVEGAQPLMSSLAELTEQVSAIRQYTSSQQDRITKLQEGYDWNIIKNFCVRIIRAIDNLDQRIAEFADKQLDAAELQEARDELIFALESSGLERFEPELGSDYHGQEKMAEVAKEKQRCHDPRLTGKIAEVLRPGYQYLIDEHHARVIRPARVKLFGEACE